MTAVASGVRAPAALRTGASEAAPRAITGATPAAVDGARLAELEVGASDGTH